MPPEARGKKQAEQQGAQNTAGSGHCENIQSVVDVEGLADQAARRKPRQRPEDAESMAAPGEM